MLKDYEPGIQEITLQLRQLVIEELAPCSEYILEVYIISLVYGSTERMKDAICYIGVMKDHVNLGFHRGTSLRDSQRILEGTGKQMRHIKFKNISDVMRSAIRDYLQEACELAGHDITAHRERTVSSSVKRKSSAKRSIGTKRL